MGKKTTTLYLDEDIVKRCKELGINISNTTERILKIVLERQPLNEEEIRLAILLGEKHKLTTTIQETEKYLSSLKQRQEYIDDLAMKQQKLVDEIKRSNEIARLIRELNRKMKDVEFDLPRIKTEAAEILKQLASYNLPTDDSWILKQIERIQRLSL